jgi:two-component system sensor histidine kinase YesM
MNKIYKSVEDFVLLKNFSIRTRLLVFFILLSAVPALIVGYISFQLSYNTLRAKAIEFSKQTIDQTSYSIDEYLSACQEIATLVSSDDRIQTNFRQNKNIEDVERYKNELEINSYLNFINYYSYEDIFGVYALGNNGTAYKSNSFTFREDDMKSTLDYQEAIESDHRIWSISINGSALVKTVPYESFITLKIPVVDKLSGDNFGIVAVDMKKELLIQTLEKSNIGNDSFLVIANESDYIVIPDEKIEAPNIDKASIAQKNGISYCMSTEGVEYILIENKLLSDWHLIGLLSVKNLQQEAFDITRNILITMFSLSIFAVILSLGVSSSVSAPIRKLTEQMKKVEQGDLTVNMESEYQDEIGHLVRGFGNMVKNINELMQKIYSDQRQLRKSQLEVLQSQINPHFLYNTLDSIVWMARRNKSEDVVKMVIALTKLLRTSLSKGDDIIYIEDEMTHVKSYLIIQEMRYSNKLKYEINVPSDVMCCKILKLTLQPIVENAIYHGIKNNNKPGVVKINCEKRQDKIVFIVEDSGLGMERERVVQLNDMLKNRTNQYGFGMRNVNERIKIYFGQQYGIYIESEYLHGSKIYISMPILEE